MEACPAPYCLLVDRWSPCLLVHRECPQRCVSIAVYLNVVAHLREPLRTQGVGFGNNDVPNATEDGEAFAVLDLVSAVPDGENEEDANVRRSSLENAEIRTWFNRSQARSDPRSSLRRGGTRTAFLHVPVAGVDAPVPVSYGIVQPAGAVAGMSSGSGQGGALKKVATTTVSSGPANAEWTSVPRSTNASRAWYVVFSQASLT
jgi:hypothetical protein